MKDSRQSAILDIIRNHPVTTQDELLARLRERGLRATQATISRDIKQLRLVKSMNQDGAYCYTAAHTHGTPVSSKFERLFADAVLHVEAACNMVVCKCIGGMAQAACAAFGTLRCPPSAQPSFLCSFFAWAPCSIRATIT